MRVASLILRCGVLLVMTGVILIAGGVHSAAASVRPDLVTRAVSVPATIAVGDTLAVASRIANTAGSGIAGRSHAGIYLSGDRSMGSGDIVLGRRGVPRLRSGRSSSATTMLFMPSSIAAGSYYAIVCADDGNRIAERREGNNCRVTPTEIIVTAPVAPVANRAPRAADDTRTTAEGVMLDVGAAQLAANDTDPDSDSLTIVSVSDAINGVVALVGSQVQFVPDGDFNGNASFTYVVSDGLLTDTASVVIAVTAINDAPIAIDDVGAISEDGIWSASTSSVLANDRDVDADSTLSVTSVSNPVNGNVSLVGTTINFTPTAFFSGNATFTYTLSDGDLTDSGVVTIAIAAVNNNPIATDDVAIGTLDTTTYMAIATLTGNDADVDGPSMNIVNLFGATNCSVSMYNGFIIFTPALGFTGIAMFSYTISDGSASESGDVMVTVT